jgi:hypothetical protein
MEKIAIMKEFEQETRIQYESEIERKRRKTVHEQEIIKHEIVKGITNEKSWLNKEKDEEDSDNRS